jgi:hypothetical protein
MKNKFLLTAAIVVGLGVAYYFLYQYNYNEAKDAMSMIMPDYMLVYAQPWKEIENTEKWLAYEYGVCRIVDGFTEKECLAMGGEVMWPALNGKQVYDKYYGEGKAKWLYGENPRLGLGPLTDMLIGVSLVYAQPNLTELDFPNLTTIEDMNEINSIKKLGAQATNEVKTFTGLINNVAGTCAYKMDQDVFNTTLAQMCADLMMDYADTLRNFSESNQEITNEVLYR